MKRKKITVGGIPIEVVSDEDADKADFIVCMREGTPTPFDDNFKGVCCYCGAGIIYRWHAPRGPKKICLECMAKLAQQPSKCNRYCADFPACECGKPEAKP
jgi:hypothetical protein